MHSGRRGVSCERPVRKKTRQAPTRAHAARSFCG
jgi:hypothetical protein